MDIYFRLDMYFRHFPICVQALLPLPQLLNQLLHLYRTQYQIHTYEVRYKFYQLSFCLVLSQTLRQSQHEPLVQPVQQHAYSEHTKPAKLVLNLSLW